MPSSASRRSSQLPENSFAGASLRLPCPRSPPCHSLPRTVPRGRPPHPAPIPSPPLPALSRGGARGTWTFSRPLPSAQDGSHGRTRSGKPSRKGKPSVTTRTTSCLKMLLSGTYPYPHGLSRNDRPLRPHAVTPHPRHRLNRAHAMPRPRRLLLGPL